MRFLVVDDDEDFVEYVLEMILSTGHFVTGTAINGVQALEMFYKYREDIDIVLMDIMMPRKNGLSTAREMRRVNPDVKIVLMSGDQKNKDLTSDLKDVDFLKKPLSRDAIMSLLAV